MTARCFAAAFIATLALAAPAYAASADVEGEWDAQSPGAGGLAELDITFDGRNFQIRAAGVCSPRPCDFGRVAGTPLVAPGGRNVARDTTGVTANFSANDGTRQIIATAAGNGRLSVTTIHSWRDGRPATITTDTFRRANRQPDVVADCTSIASNPRIRFQGGQWVIAQGNQALATFDSPDEAGYARFIISAYGFRQKCEIAEAGFQYWTVGNGAFPSGAQAGESCRNVNTRQISVQRAGRQWQVRSGSTTLYTSQDRAAADTVAQILIDNRPAAQCTIGAPGRGMTYFRR